jgi:RNA polymerase sigma factor (sigma-70 family)
MDPEELFRANLPVVDRVIGEVCRAARLSQDEAEDFRSSVRLALVEDDYAILRRWEGRSSLAGFLSVVIRHLLADRRNRELGRWQVSAEAARNGAAGVLLETLVMREGRSVDEALPIVRAHDPSLTRDAAAAMIERFPQRVRPLRAVDLDAAGERFLASTERADHRVLSEEARRLSRRASDVVRRAITSWSDEDAMILRFHFGSSMTIARISRMLRLPQRPLYRRIESLLAHLREALREAHLDADVLAGVIGEASQEMDFGLTDVKIASAEQSIEEDTVVASEQYE